MPRVCSASNDFGFAPRADDDSPEWAYYRLAGPGLFTETVGAGLRHSRPTVGLSMMPPVGSVGRARISGAIPAGDVVTGQ